MKMSNKCRNNNKSNNSYNPWTSRHIDSAKKKKGKNRKEQHCIHGDGSCNPARGIRVRHCLPIPWVFAYVILC